MMTKSDRGTSLTDADGSAWRYAYDPADRIVSAGARTFPHDANGRLARDDKAPGWSVSYAYDPFDRPSRVSGLRDPVTEAALPDTTVSYAPLTPDLSFTPGPLGARVSKTDSGGVSQYVVDATGNLLDELGADGTPRARYLYGAGLDEPLALTDSGGRTLYMLTDGQGSVRMLTDASGDPAQQYEYEPFGEPSARTRELNNLKYTAREHDADSGLQYNRARYLDPSIGKWTTPDPMGLVAGSDFYGTVALLEPNRLEGCPYAENQPTSLRDPGGLSGIIIPPGGAAGGSTLPSGAFPQPGMGTSCDEGGRRKSRGDEFEIDTSPLIYVANQNPAFGPQIASHLQQNRGKVFISVRAYVEATNKAETVGATLGAMRTYDIEREPEVPTGVALGMAIISGLKFPGDAEVAASAIQHGRSLIVTDEQFWKLKRLLFLKPLGYWGVKFQAFQPGVAF